MKSLIEQSDLISLFFYEFSMWLKKILSIVMKIKLVKLVLILLKEIATIFFFYIME